MLRNAASKSALIAPEVAPASGNKGLITVPLIVGVEPLLPQRPKPPAASTATALHVAPAIGSSTTFPLIVVIGRVVVLVTPAVAAIPNGAANPRFTGARPVAAGVTVLKFHAKLQATGVPVALVTAPWAIIAV
jgi:hypothetical protein